MVGGERIELTISDEADLETTRRILARYSASDPRVDGRSLIAPISGGPYMLTDVLQELAGSNVRLADVGLRKPTLDDVFLTLTGRVAEAGAPDVEQDEILEEVA